MCYQAVYPVMVRCWHVRTLRLLLLPARFMHKLLLLLLSLKAAPL
jgi:hypothetical protein